MKIRNLCNGILDLTVLNNRCQHRIARKTYADPGTPKLTIIHTRFESRTILGNVIIVVCRILIHSARIAKVKASQSESPLIEASTFSSIAQKFYLVVSSTLWFASLKIRTFQ